MDNYNPKYFCKYKPFVNLKDLEYTIDILKNNRFHLSSINKLNDVFECPLVGLQLAVAGSGIYASQGQLDPSIEEKIDKYRILSLTEDYLHEIMWAHYTSNYNGMCIVVRNNPYFEECRKVNYTKNEINPELIEENLDEIIYDSMFVKNSGWKYEKEYRVVKDADYGKYFYFGQNQIECIIIGHKINLKSGSFIELYKVAKEHDIKMYKTYINRFKGRLSLVSLNFEPKYDGSPLEEIFI